MNHLRSLATAPSSTGGYIDPAKGRLPLGEGTLSVTADMARSVVHIVGDGLWSVETIDQHFIELERVAWAVHRRTPSIRVLVDLRESAVQTPEIAERIKLNTARIWSEEDRIAVVVRSILSGLQINRVVDGGHYRTFSDYDAATAWLGL